MAQASVALVTLPVTFVLARSLTPAGLGQFQFVNRVALIAISIAHLGYPHAFAWAAARLDERVGLRPLVRRAIVMAMWQGIPVVMLGLLCAAFHGSHGTTSEWMLIAAYPLVNIMTADIAAIYRGALRLHGFTLIRVSQAGAWLAGILLLHEAQALSVATAIAALLLSQVFSLCVALGCAARLASSDEKRLPPNEARQLAQFSRRVFPGLTIRDWNLYLDQIIVGLFLSARALGLYAVAVSATAALALLAAPFVNTAQPVIQRTDAGDRAKATSQLLAAAVSVVGAAALVLFATAVVVVPWAYGSDYTGSVILVQILCLASTIDAINATLHGVLVGCGRPSLSSVAAILGFGANILCWAVLLPTWGVLGAALTSVVSYFVIALAMGRGVTQCLDVSGAELASLTLSSFRRIAILALRPARVGRRAIRAGVAE